MCGIIGGVTERNITPILLEGLKRLEYRGYDSAGLAVMTATGSLQHRRCIGKVQCLVEALQSHSPIGRMGIAHTRWATHGAPCEKNAHPHLSGGLVAVVHNGIIDNHEEWRLVLEEKGYFFQSDTDTEVMAHLLHDCLKERGSLLSAARQVSILLKGHYAAVMISQKPEEGCVLIRKGPPLLIGIGIEEHFVASDILALSALTDKIVALDNGDVAVLFKDHYQITDATGQEVQRLVKPIHALYQGVERGSFRHFMHKEIFEQPAVFSTLLGEDRLLLSGADLKPIDAVHIVACGSSYYAGLIAAQWIEYIAKIPTRVFLSSEYRMQPPVLQGRTLWIGISQSGETADTLAALEQAKGMPYQQTLALCNVEESALVHVCDEAVLTCAGPEIGVASTKGFSSQLMRLFTVACRLGKQEKTYAAELQILPALIENTLLLEARIQEMAYKIAERSHAFFLGRGYLYPLALEGALKLKEIAYIHAQGYAGGELKHGPLALMDHGTTVIVHLCASKPLIAKMQSNIEEVEARGGECFILSDERVNISQKRSRSLLSLPSVLPILAPFVHIVPAQLLAYHVGVLKGTDVDQPRNLAKSVTVE
jgi:glutamine---fructose-6-phosphate transaminase (isomerizing)